MMKQDMLATKENNSDMNLSSLELEVERLDATTAPPDCINNENTNDKRVKNTTKVTPGSRDHKADIAAATVQQEGVVDIQPDQKGSRLLSLEDTLEGIQDIPEDSRRRRRPDSGIPGAHAIAGSRPFPPRSNQNVLCALATSRTTRNDTSSELGTSNGGSSPLSGFLVVEEEEEPSNHLSHLEEAQEVVPLPRNNGSSSQQSKPCASTSLFAFVLVLVALLVLIPWLVVQSSSSFSSSSSSPTVQDNSAVDDNLIATLPPFQEDLPTVVLKAIREEPYSPSAKANQWMWRDPYLPGYTKERQRQRFGLVSLYFATQGDQWTHKTDWLSYQVSECKWFLSAMDEPVCDDQDNLLTLDLSHNNLNGTLPGGFWLPKPRHVNLANNHLEGQVPPFPSNSEQLEVLSLCYNNFTGRLTGGAGLIVENVRVVLLNSNSFQGSETAAIYRLLPKLEILNFTDNWYSGPMSPNLQYLTSLKYLGGGHSDKEGPLVSELGLLTKLEVLDYSSNSLMTGAIPSELGLLTNLVRLDLEGTQLAGTLPKEFCTPFSEGEEALQISVNCSSIQCCGAE